MDDKWHAIRSGGKADEQSMKDEFLWQVYNNKIREYMFVCVIQDLDDDIPF